MGKARDAGPGVRAREGGTEAAAKRGSSGGVEVVELDEEGDDEGGISLQGPKGEGDGEDQDDTEETKEGNNQRKVR